MVLADRDMTIYFSRIHTIDLRAVLDAEDCLTPENVHCSPYAKRVRIPRSRAAISIDAGDLKEASARDSTTL